MKNNKILTFCTILFLLTAAISCSDDDPIIPEKKHTVFKYVATENSHIEDFNVYVGPKGEKIEGNDYLAKTFWKEGSSLGEAVFDTLILDMNTDTIYLKTEWSTIPIKIKMSGDTVKRDQNNTFEYYGRLSGDSTFILNRAFYFINYKGRENGHGEYPEVGHYGMWRYYEVARFDEFFHENSAFGSLSDMVLVSDTIAYLTDYYKFKLAKSY